MPASPEISLPYIPPAIALDTLSPDSLGAGARNVAESDRPRAGYPGLIPGYPGTRLYMGPEDLAAATKSEEVYELSNGKLTKIHRVQLPPGHDTASTSRQAFLADPANIRNLIYPPVPDIVTGSTDRVDPESFQTWLDMGFRVFDQHDRVMPGSLERIAQLLALRTAGQYGRQLGMPVGNGTFASPGPHPASDPFILMPLPETDDLAMLVWGHERTEQSHEVWVPPGGFGSREDIVDGRYSSWQAAVRLCLRKAGFDISTFPHWIVHQEFALSSPSTINSILVPESHLVKVPYSQDIAAKVLYEIPTGDDIRGTQWLSLGALIKLNTKLRRDGADPNFDHQAQPDHVYWDTHMRGLVRAVNLLRSNKQWQAR